MTADLWPGLPGSRQLQRFPLAFFGFLALESIMDPMAWGLLGDQMDNVKKDPTPVITPSSTGLQSPRRRGKWKTVALGLAILLCGILIGAGGTVICVQKILVHAIHHPEEAPARITARLRKKLDLSDDQAVRVKAILSERQKAIQAIRRETQPKVMKEFEKTKEEVASILTPDQARLWRSRFEQLQRRWIPVLPAEPK